MISEILINTASGPDPAEAEFALPNITVAWYKIKEIILPAITQYPVNTSNNTVVFYEDDGAKHSFRIPEGQYNQVTFRTALEEALNNAGTQTYTVVFDSITKKLSIHSSGNFKIGSYDLGCTGYRLIGSDEHITPNKGTSYTAPYQIDLANTGVFLLCSSSLNSHYNIYLGNRPMNVLAMIPNTQSGSIVQYVPDSEWMHCGQSLSSIDLRILDGTTHRTIPEFRGPMYVRLAIADEIDDVIQG